MNIFIYLTCIPLFRYSEKRNYSPTPGRQPMKKVVFFVALVTTFLASFSFAETKTVVLQQGLDEYTGSADQELRDPKANYGQGPKEELLVLSEW
jgi:uncharacterized membrane protein